MQRREAGVVGVAAGGGQFVAVALDRGNDGGGLAHDLAAGGDRAGGLLRLEERQNGIAVALLVVVGGREGLGPVAALAVGAADDPGAGDRVAAVAEREPGSQLQPERLALDRELEPRGPAFEWRLSEDGGFYQLAAGETHGDPDAWSPRQTFKHRRRGA